MHGFSKSDLAEGKRLLDDARILSLLFSEGTYQIEVLSSKKPKEVLWPFIQITDEGEVIDAFCTCSSAEENGSCSHLAAAFLKIMREEPLHVRFRESLWNQIALICAERHGYEPRCLKIGKEAYEAFSLSGKRMFSLQVKGALSKEIEQLLFNRPLETEETSLKFSNLPVEELTLWREGRPSDHLLYELSFWSDLAKWWMLKVEEGVKYLIEFSQESPPQILTIHFPNMRVEFFLDLDHWPMIIPTLQHVESPIKAHPFAHGHLQKIVFLKDKGIFSLEYEEEGILPPEQGEESSDAVKLGEWYYAPGRGFFPRESDSLLMQKTILKHQMNAFLTRHMKIVQKYLRGEKIHPIPITPRYHLEFDDAHFLHLVAYLFERGDLTQQGAFYFGDFAYLPEQGFYELENQVIDQAHLKVPKEKVADFVNRHRVWLHSFEGFQTHVSGVESHLSYTLGKKLVFHTRLEFTEEKEHIIDLGEWIYVKGKGFYSKVTARPGAFVKAGMEVELTDLSHFILQHREELEPVPGFFAHQCPLEKSGLNISFNERNRIKITPEFFFHSAYLPENVKIFGDYTYVEGEGFALIPHAFRLPESYKVEKVIDPLSESYFVSYELELLYPHVLKIDPKLRRPKRMDLHLLMLKREEEAKTGQWVLDLVYETDIGRVTPFEIWEAMWAGKQYLFSEAGLLFLTHKRYDWIRLKNKKRWLKKGGSIRLLTLEFFRLSAIEEFVEPKGKGKKAIATRTLLSDFLALKAPTEIDLTGLKSDLRLYQKTGVAWLWFLYSYGLSGLLCDEMGLGKTHQAMALIAGIKNAHPDKKTKFLVVCPTSVIYHWEKLIQNFLPKMSTYVFHGIGRNFEAFSQDSYDILLTSYGITRTENKALSGYHFELAIFDELQIAKNEKSLTNKALRELDAGMRLGLSGTPIENRLLELKALFDLVIPTYLPGHTTFREIFINPIEKYDDEDRRAFLARLIRPFLLRRKKSEVLLELPEKIEEVVVCDLSETQAQLYHEIVAQNRDAILKDLEDTNKPPPIAHIFSLLSKLKQVCDHPCLINKDIKHYEKYPSGKWDLFVELLEETRDSGQKLVVFTQYLGMLDIFAQHLKEKNIQFAQIRGSTRNRKEEVERFAQDPKCEVFLGSLQAAGVGIDLIAASVVIHYDRWWNPAKENQATDRVHRMGQKRGVQVFKLVTKNTIEEHIHFLIERKLSLVKGVIGFDDQDQIKGLERKELIELLKALE